MGTSDRIEEFSRGGLTFDVVDRGPLDGDVVVLLHGFPQRASSWDAVAQRLNDAGLRTLAPDQRGYSPRARPPHRWHYRLPELVADVVALIDEIRREVHLVGHDWGGAVAWAVAARDPRVRSLTSVSVPHPAAFMRSTLSRSQLRRSWYVLAFQLPFLAEWSASSGRFERELRRGGMTDRELATVRRDILDDGALPGGLAWYRAMPLALSGAPSLWRERVKVPVTHVWSDGDVAVGRGAAELARQWADGEFELRVIDGHTHWLPEQAPDELAAIILDRVRSSEAHQAS